MVDPLGRRYVRKFSQVRKISHLLSSHSRTWKMVVVAILGNTKRSRVVISKSPWTSSWILEVWKRWESHLQSQKIILEYQERGWLPLWVSMSKQVQRNTKRQGMSSEISVWRNFKILSGILRNLLMKVMRGRGPNMIPLIVNFTWQDSLQSVWWELMPSTRMFTL